MNKRQILLIGCGKAGNRLINEIMEKESLLTGLFVNTSYDDMAKLSKVTEENVFLFSSANGSGRNRNIAQQYVKDQVKSLVDVITRYPMHNNIYIFTSADGGTGSGITPMICQLLRATFKSKNLDRRINLVAIMPDQKIDDRLAFENAIGFWNDIVMERSDKQGNKFTIKDEGDIDDRDSKTFNTKKGFSLILTLPSGFDNAKDAVDKAIEDTVFAKPDNYNCNYIGISLNESDYIIEDVRSCFDKVYKTTYKTYNSKGHNTVVLSGCSNPNEIITSIKQKLEELNSSNIDIAEKVDLTVNLTNTINKSDKVKTEKNVKVTFTDTDLDAIASAIDDLF